MVSTLSTEDFSCGNKWSHSHQRVLWTAEWQQLTIYGRICRAVSLNIISGNDEMLIIPF